MTAGTHAIMGAAPIVFVCALAGVVASVGQVGFKPATKALKPDFKKLNPLTRPEEHVQPELGGRGGQVDAQDRRRRRDHRARDLPEARRRWPASSACPPPPCSRTSAA